MRCNLLTLIKRFQNSLPPVEHARLRRIVLSVFLVSFLAYLPTIWEMAERVDSTANRTVPGNWDDWHYQVLAINVLRGHGFSDQLYSSWETYHLSNPMSGGPLSGYQDYYSFYRAPGFPLVLSASYALFGDQTLTARRLMLLMAWITAMLLSLIGSNIVGWLGAIAGGLTGHIYLKNAAEIVGGEGIHNGRLLSEPVTTFWMILFACLFSEYLKKKQPPYLYFAALCFTGLIYTRAYFLMTLPLFFIYLYFSSRNLKQVVIFAFITLLPIIAWSLYATSTAKKLVIFTTQGQYDFPRFNNKDVITGFGPERMNQGAWQPGFSYNENGDVIITNQNSPKPGENGWIKGLKFWAENPKKLPKLFYVKMRAGLWYTEGRLYLVGIGFLLMGIGFRRSKKTSSQGLSSVVTLTLQLALITLLSIVANTLPFTQVLSIWLAIFLISLVYPYGDVCPPGIQLPNWFLIILSSYLIVVILYGGNPRFHNALDPFILLISLAGLFLILYRLIKTALLLTALFLLINLASFKEILNTLSK